MDALQLAPKQQVTLAGSAVLMLIIAIPVSVKASEPQPFFEKSATYTTQIPRTDGGSDPAQIYYPVSSRPKATPEKWPIALMLQGALVDQADYAKFASLVARYGFAVVVPNHARTAKASETRTFSGFLSEQQQVNDVLAFLKTENANTSAPIAGRIDTSKLGLLGHSLGGAVGLAAVQNICVPILCIEEYRQPPELKAAALYAAPFSIARRQNAIPAIKNQGVPVALLAGEKDGVTSLADIKETYEQLQERPKALIIISGANHYGITNADNLERDPNRPVLEQSVATKTIARWSALFLRAVMLDDTNAFNYVFRTGDALDPNVTTTTAIPPSGSNKRLFMPTK